MTRQKRLLLLSAAGVGAVFIVALLALVVFFPTERVAALAAERASIALDRDVRVGSVRLKLWPVAAVSLGQVRVAGGRRSDPAAAAAALPPLAEIARVEVRPRLLPLLRRSIELRGVLIDRPVLSIRPGSDENTSGTERSGFWDETTFSIRDFRISDGIIEYVDTVSATTVRLVGLNQRLRLEGDVEGGELARLRLTGDISVDSLSADAPEAVAFPVRDLAVGVEHDVLLDLGSRTATIDSLALRVREFALAGSGQVSAWADPEQRHVSIRFAADDADIGGLIASLPEAFRSWPRNAADGEELTAVGGRLGVRATAEGRFGAGELPVVDGHLTLSDIALARGRESLVTALRGGIGFTLDSLATDGLTADLLGEPLRTVFAIHDFAAPRLDGSLETRLDLGRAAALGLFPEGWEASGILPIAVTATGPVTDLESMSVDGAVGTSGMSLRGVDWPAELKLIDGELDLSNQEIVGRGLNATFGSSDMTLELAAANWLPFALGDTVSEPRVAFEARSRFVDMDELFPSDPSQPTYAQLFFARLAGTPVNGATATEAAEAAGLNLPRIPRVLLDGRFRADRVTQREADYRDVDVRIAGRDGQLELRDVSLSTFGGNVQLAARLGAARDLGEGGRAAPLEVSFQIDEVDADSFLHRFTAFRDNLSGSLLLAGAMTLTLDEHLLPDPGTLSANGTLSVLDGQLANWTLVRRFGDQLGIARFDSLAFRDWTGGFSMLGSRIVLEESTLEGDDFGASAAGWFDVAGQLELGATAYIGSDITSRVQGGPASTLLTAASGSDGRIPVGLRITGTRTDPNVRLDLSEAGSRVAERVREEAEAEARELARSLAERAAQRVIGTDSGVPLPAPGGAVDGAVQRAQDAVVGRLRGLLGSPGRNQPQEPPPPPEDAAPAPPAAEESPAAGADSTVTSP